jgi:hypothetical protein
MPEPAPMPEPEPEPMPDADVRAGDVDHMKLEPGPHDASAPPPPPDAGTANPGISTSPGTTLFARNLRAFAPLWADPREAQFRMGFTRDSAGETWWDLNLGGDLIVLRADRIDAGVLTLSGRALFSARFKFFTPSFDLYNTDFIGGAAAGFRHGPTALELLLYHESSHLGDEILERGEQPRIDYSREAVRLLASHQPRGGPIRLYGGLSVNLHADPEALEHRFVFQAGAQGAWRVGRVPVYGAIDLQWKQENGWHLNVTPEAGVYLGSFASLMHEQRIYVSCFNGYSNMGQFWDRPERSIQVGLAYNFE